MRTHAEWAKQRPINRFHVGYPLTAGNGFNMRSAVLTQNQPISLSPETLEDRMMLSSVEIFAAGATGEENLDLPVHGEVVQAFFNVGGDASTRQFERFTFETDQTVTPGNIGIRSYDLHSQ